MSRPDGIGGTEFPSLTWRPFVEKHAVLTIWGVYFPRYGVRPQDLSHCVSARRSFWMMVDMVWLQVSYCQTAGSAPLHVGGRSLSSYTHAEASITCASRTCVG
jgi:hypothetical protein